MDPVLKPEQYTIDAVDLESYELTDAIVEKGRELGIVVVRHLLRDDGLAEMQQTVRDFGERFDLARDWRSYRYASEYNAVQQSPNYARHRSSLRTKTGSIVLSVLDRDAIHETFGTTSLPKNVMLQRYNRAGQISERLLRRVTRYEVPIVGQAGVRIKKGQNPRPQLVDSLAPGDALLIRTDNATTKLRIQNQTTGAESPQRYSIVAGYDGIARRG